MAGSSSRSDLIFGDSNYFNEDRFGYYMFKPKIYPPPKCNPGDNSALWIGIDSITCNIDIQPLDANAIPPAVFIKFVILDKSQGFKSMNTIEAVIIFYLYAVNRGESKTNNLIAHPEAIDACDGNWSNIAGTVNCPEVVGKTGQFSGFKYRIANFDFSYE